MMMPRPPAGFAHPRTNAPSFVSGLGCGDGGEGEGGGGGRGETALLPKSSGGDLMPEAVGGGGSKVSVMGHRPARAPDDGKPRAGSRRGGPSQTGEPLYPLRLRVTRGMAAGIDAAAMAVGLTGAAWVRGVVADRLDMDDPADRQPVRRYSGGGPDAAALTALRLQLRQTGGLITQGAKESRLAGIPTHPDLEMALADIKHALAVITEWQHALRPGGAGSAQEVNTG